MGQMKLEQYFSSLCRSAGGSAEQVLFCGQHHALPSTVLCAHSCFNSSWLFTLLMPLASTGLPMKCGLEVVLQLFSSFLPCISLLGLTCPSHCAILEDVSSWTNVESARLFIFHHPPDFPYSQFPAPGIIYKISSNQISCSSWMYMLSL